MEFALISWRDNAGLTITRPTQGQFLVTIACHAHSHCPDVETFPLVLEGYIDSLGIEGSYFTEDIHDILNGLIQKENVGKTRGVFVYDIGLFIITDTHNFWPSR